MDNYENYCYYLITVVHNNNILNAYVLYACLLYTSLGTRHNSGRRALPSSLTTPGHRNYGNGHVQGFRQRSRCKRSERKCMGSVMSNGEKKTERERDGNWSTEGAHRCTKYVCAHILQAIQNTVLNIRTYYVALYREYTYTVGLLCMRYIRCIVCV